MYRIFLYLIFYLLGYVTINISNAYYEINYPSIRQFIYWIETDNKEALAKHVEYPINRKKPIPPINNTEEFIARYNEIFDKELIELIVTSDLGKDWHGAGWRGVMLKLGQVWLDYDGKLKAINYQSKFEKKKQAELIDLDRKRLHPSIQQFETPVLEWKTKSYTIRIDKMGDWKYRYVSWQADKQVSDNPDVISIDGEIIFLGSGGNHNYDFKNGEYTYRIHVNILGKYSHEEAPGCLDIYKANKLFLREEAYAYWSNRKYITALEFIDID